MRQASLSHHIWTTIDLRVCRETLCLNWLPRLCTYHLSSSEDISLWGSQGSKVKSSVCLYHLYLSSSRETKKSMPACGRCAFHLTVDGPDITTSRCKAIGRSLMIGRDIVWESQDKANLAPLLHGSDSFVSHQALTLAVSTLPLPFWLTRTLVLLRTWLNNAR